MAAIIALARGVADPGSAPGHGHADRVGFHSARLGAAMGLAAPHCGLLMLAGLVHDVGKAALPQSILVEPGPLTGDELKLMRRHPELGAAMLRGHRLAGVRWWIRCHHERPDGLGYPYGLPSEETPIEAQIIAVADAYVAMTGRRPYRQAMSSEDARDELRAGAGSQFNPDVVSLFLRLGHPAEESFDPRW